MDEKQAGLSFPAHQPTTLKFGTSGIRGLVTDMTDLECYINTKGFLHYELETGDIRKGERVAIAGDLRVSTPRIMAAVAEAIRDSGCAVDNCGFIPTQALAYYAMQKGYAGLMITGSHIPEDRNGIKPYRKNGEVLKTDEAGILHQIAMARESELQKPPGESIFQENGMFKQARSPGTVNKEAGMLFLRRYLDIFPPNCLSSRTLVLYEHSAVGRDLLAVLLRGLGATVIPVGRSEEFVALDTENITGKERKFFKHLSEEYRSRKIMAIISTDGDSDRPLIVDEQGDFHRGDMTGILVSQYLDARFAAVPVSVNDAVDIQLHDDGIDYTHTKIGSPYVIAAMNEAICEGRLNVVGWEVNGGYLTGTDFILHNKVLKALPTRDSFLPIICVLLQAARKGLPLSELYSRLPRRYSQAGLLDNFPISISRKIMEYFSLPPETRIRQVDFQNNGLIVIDETGKTSYPGGDEYVAALIRERKQMLEHYFSPRDGFSDIVRINYHDGIKITFSGGDVGHIRPSGNAPQMRIYANADSQERADEIVSISIREPDGILKRMEKDLGAAG